MYLEHFGLREVPFRITPHTDFFFAGANRGATLDALIYAITHDEGIVKVSGEVGSGKTMLCRMLLEKLPAQVETVYLANPSLSRDEILYAIAAELQAPLAADHTHLLLRTLQDRLLDIYAAGRQVVVLIDEAHAMPTETLEEIRLLSNLESNRHKLLQIVLFGQPELDARLNDMSMRQLKERITHNFELEALRRDDIGSYLMFRMRAAGYHGPDLFTPAAIQLISQSSEGLTRRINILAAKALLSAFSEGEHQIDRKQVQAAIRDAQIVPMRTDKAKRSTRIGVAALSTAMFAAIYLLLGGVNSPAKESSSPTPHRETIATVRTPITPMPPTPVIAAQTPLETPVPTPPVVETTPPPSLSRLLAERSAATDAWLKKTPDASYFIHLLSAHADKQREVERFIADNSASLDPRQVGVYRFQTNGNAMLGVIYGDYASYASANADLSKQPKTIHASRPYIRLVGKLRSEISKQNSTGKSF
jgi:MSHA biogenesis protein MshM